jgi:hypothetical protein
MAGKFLKRGAIIDVLKSQERTNAIQKREGLDRHPVTFILCGCPDPNCGGWHTIDAEHQVPSAEDCAEIIRSPMRMGRPTRHSPQHWHTANLATPNSILSLNRHVSTDCRKNQN